VVNDGAGAGGAGAGAGSGDARWCVGTAGIVSFVQQYYRPIECVPE
jgi:hypothetical protein